MRGSNAKDNQGALSMSQLKEISTLLTKRFFGCLSPLEDFCLQGPPVRVGELDSKDAEAEQRGAWALHFGAVRGGGSWPPSSFC